MTDYQRIITLLLQGNSYRDIEIQIGCSHRDIGRASRAITQHDITDTTNISDDQLAAWFPDGRRRITAEYDQPDLDKTLAAMKASRHFTLLQAWRRYTDQPAATKGLKKYGYSQFCALFAAYANTHDLVATLHHEPGKVMFVDWAGDTLSLIDAASGDTTTAYLFTAALPYSGVIFVQASLSMQSPAWLDAHIAAFTYFDGVPQLLVPDNPTTSTYRPKKHDPERLVNSRYQDLADHYQTTVVPARVRKPRDKAAVERAVKTINTRVIGYLDQEIFHTLAELNDAITERLQEINHGMPQADGTTRWERFCQDEHAFLTRLPEYPFTEVTWKSPKVGRNYHVSIDTHKYSVPYTYAGQLVRARLTTSQVTIFDRSDTVIAEHTRRTGRKGQYTTNPDHVPPQHRDVDGLWTSDWFLTRAQHIGPATRWAISQVLDRHQIEAHGYLDCHNILDGLGKKNRVLLEAASERLKQRDGHVTYTMLKRTMASITSDEQAPTMTRPAASTKKNTPATMSTDPGVYVRDASHYAFERDQQWRSPIPISRNSGP